MDNFYGCPSRCDLADSVGSIGFDRTLETYSDDTKLIKELLNSSDPVDYLFGMLLASYPFYDEGHTSFFLNSGVISKTNAGKKFRRETPHKGHGPEERKGHHPLQGIWKEVQGDNIRKTLIKL